MTEITGKDKIKIIIEDYWREGDSLFIKEKDTGHVFQFKNYIISSLKYEFPGQSADNNEITLVGNNKIWNKEG